MTLSPFSATWRNDVKTEIDTLVAEALPFSTGTTSATLTFVTPGDVSVSYNRRQIEWIKTGDYLEFWLDYSGTMTFTTASGALVIQGLPETSGELVSGGGGWPAIFGNFSGINFGATDVQLTARVTANADTISLLFGRDNAGGALVAATTNITSNAPFAFLLYGKYRVA